MDEKRLVMVFEAGDEIEALLHKQLLEEAGIDVVEQPLEPEWLEGVQQRGLHSQLLVAEEDAAQAGELINAFTREADSGELQSETPQSEAEDADNDDE